MTVRHVDCRSCVGDYLHNDLQNFDEELPVWV